MKKIIFIFLILLNLSSCNKSKFDISIGMSKEEIKSNILINKDNFFDLNCIVLVSISNNNYVIELDKNNKVVDYNIYKEPKTKQKKLRKLYKTLEKIEFYDLICNYGFPDYIIRHNGEKNDVWIDYNVVVSKKPGDLYKGVTIKYYFYSYDNQVFYAIMTTESIA